jgi:hypothetical protein
MLNRFNYSYLPRPSPYPSPTRQAGRSSSLPGYWLRFIHIPHEVGWVSLSGPGCSLLPGVGAAMSGSVASGAKWKNLDQTLGGLYPARRAPSTIGYGRNGGVRLRTACYMVQCR